MDQSLIGRLARTRWTLPVVLACAVAALAVIYALGARIDDERRRAAEAVQVRLAISRIWQGIATSSVGVQSHLLTRSAVDLTQARDFAAQVLALRGPTLQRAQRLDPEGAELYARLSASVEQRIALHLRWLQYIDESRRDEVVDDLARAATSERRAALRDDLDLAITRIGAVEQAKQRQVDAALGYFRAALMAMVLVALAALYLVMHSLGSLAELRERQKAQLAREVQARTAELTELAGHLTRAREDERTLLARELHDELGALLTSCKLEISRLRRLPQIAEPAVQPRLDALSRTIDGVIALKRRIIEDLHPSALAHLGLADSLRMLAGEAAARMEIPVHADVDGADTQPPLAQEGQLALYRLVQEGLTNIAKYADARAVTLRVSAAADHIAAELRDDGRGFDAARATPGSHGLRGMRLRFESLGGTLAVDSAPGAGTTLRARLPRGAASAQAADATTVPILPAHGHRRPAQDL